MLDKQTIQALVTDLGIDEWDIPQVDLHTTAKRTCEGPCSRPVDIRVSTGVRFVCLDCAVALTEAHETGQAVPA